MKTYLVTGAAGFIGANYIKYILAKHSDVKVVILDALTYAGNLGTIAKDIDNERCFFIKGDICSREVVDGLFAEYRFDYVVNFAAESHVDRSIHDPLTFARTNVMGTLALLEAAHEAWNGAWEGKRFHHVSTDEVYGALGFDGTLFTERTRYDPHSPYSASKASSDHFVRAFHDTYGLPTVVTNCSNNYGPYQFPEKLIPLFINNIRHRKPLPVNGRGENVRDWIHTEDHSSAVWEILTRGRIGETYLIGADGEMSNIAVMRMILRLMGCAEDAFDWVRDRPGHDRRYAIDSSKLRTELGWKPVRTDFEAGLQATIAWYAANRAWWEPAKAATEARYRAQGQ